MSARCQRSSICSASARRPRSSALWRSRRRGFLAETFSAASAARIRTTGFSSQRHSMSWRKRLGSLRTSCATSSARPMERRSDPSSIAAIFGRDMLRNVAYEDLGAGAAGLGAFAAEVGGDDFHGAAHFEKAGAHAAADSLVEGIFAGGHDEFSAGKPRGFAFLSRIVIVIRRDNRGAPLVVAGVQDDADDVADPIGRFASAEIIEDQDFNRADGFENAHFRGFASRVVAGLDFFEEFAVIAEEAGVAAAN